ELPDYGEVVSVVRPGYGQQDYLQALLPGPFAESHGSNLLALPNGGLLCAWYSTGGVPSRRRSAVVVSRLITVNVTFEESSVDGDANVTFEESSVDGGVGPPPHIPPAPPPRRRQAQMWTHFQTVVPVEAHEGLMHEDPVLVYNGNETRGNVSLLYSVLPGEGLAGAATAEVWSTSSMDPDYQQWTAPVRLPFSCSANVRNHVLLGVAGHVAIPATCMPGGKEGAASHYSVMGRMNMNGSEWEEVEMTRPGSGLVDPSIVAMPQMRGVLFPSLVAFFRDRSCQSIYKALSVDDGRSWSEPEALHLPNSNQPIQALFLPGSQALPPAGVNINSTNPAPRRTTSGGRLVMAFNNARGEQEPGRDMKGWPLSLALSYDGGSTWPYVHDVEAVFDPSLQYTHPSLQLGEADGRLHLTYTWSTRAHPRTSIRYISITENWVKQRTPHWSTGFTRGAFQGDAHTLATTDNFN
ncbi:hypothetical protein CYMTET_6861, partial [Cymbomonas tetramitiformis]